jgi:hypothetical protein
MSGLKHPFGHFVFGAKAADRMTKSWQTPPQFLPYALLNELCVEIGATLEWFPR